MSLYLKIEGKFEEGRFLSRPNRFLGIVSISGKSFECHIPNPGRMKELMIKNIRVFLKKADNPNRKTRFDMVGVDLGLTLVSMDSQLPNKLLYYSLTHDLVPEVRYPHVQKEKQFGDSRIDFFLQDDKEKCLMEVKSCTLVHDGLARFPDAPTKRGSRHVRELIEAKKKGMRSIVFFCIQRPDASSFSPNDETDPMFGRVLRRAASEGVEILAYTCNYSITEIELKSRVKIVL